MPQSLVSIEIKARPCLWASPCCLLSQRMRAKLGVQHLGTMKDHDLWGVPRTGGDG